MRTAKLITVEVEIECPECLQPVESTTGSHLWPMFDIELLVTKGGPVFICNNCGEEFRIPKRVPATELKL